MAIIIWLAIFACIVGFGFLATKMVSQDKEDTLNDVGLAILEFGRAFPMEAIRQLQKTKDGQALFVRLHDNKAGFMRDQRNHFSCHLIQPTFDAQTPEIPVVALCPNQSNRRPDADDFGRYRKGMIH